MKKLLVLLPLLLLPLTVEAAELSTTVPSGSQYAPGNTYGFQINCNDISGVTSVLFEWNGSPNVTASGTYPNFYRNVVNIPAGDYSYKWFVENATDVFVFSGTYSIAKSTETQLFLKLDGDSSDKSYDLNKIAKFTVNLNIPNTLVRLESNYPGFVTKTNTTSYIYYSFNLSEYGIYTATASWDGNQNYTASSVTYRFDNGPPHISNIGSTPQSPIGYEPGEEYKFQINCDDATLKDVWFESNHTGSMKKYYDDSDTPVKNSSGVYWIDLGGLEARNFSYRWYAKDDEGDTTTTDFVNYQILKMNPLVMELLPSMGIMEGTQVTASCKSINSIQINSSKFYFFKDGEPIENMSTSVKLGVFLMNAGKHNFTCYTQGNENYTNQSIIKIIDVKANLYEEEEEEEGDLEIISIDMPDIEAGNLGEATIKILNGLFKNVFNATVKLSGIPEGWYKYDVLKSIYRENVGTIKVNISVPIDTEYKEYPLIVDVNVKDSEGKTLSLRSSSSLRVTSPFEDKPPSYATSKSETEGSNFVFSLYISDDKGISGYIFSSNITGMWINETWVSKEGGSGWINITKGITTKAGDSVAWKIYANDTSDQWTASDENIIITKPAETFDMSLVLILIAMIIIAVAVVVILKTKKKKPVTEYIYSEDDLNEK